MGEQAWVGNGKKNMLGALILPLSPDFAGAQNSTPSGGVRGPNRGTSSKPEGPHRAALSTTGSHRSQGPECCTPCYFELIMHASVGGWFSEVYQG